MQSSKIWLIISVVFVLLIAAGIGSFLRKHSRTLPSISQVECQFESEIEALTELTSRINLEELLYRPGQALSNSRIEEVREQFSESSLLSVSVTFTHPGSRNRVYVVHDDTLNLWSPSWSQEEKGACLAFCYSGLRQLIRYERITRVEFNQTVGFELVFPEEVLDESQ